MLLLALLACAAPTTQDDPLHLGDTASDSHDSGAGSDTADGPPVEEEGPLVDEVAVEPHPSFGSLLQVSWQQHVPGTAWVRYRVDEEWRQTPVRTLGVGPQEQVVAGLPYGWEVELQVVVSTHQEQAASAATTAWTTDPPEGLPAPTVELARPWLFDPHTAFVMVNTNEPGSWDTGWWTMILDRQGRVVWARPSDEQTSTIFGAPAPGGRSLLLDQSTFWTLFDQGERSEVLELQLDGTVLQRWSTPGLHHDFVGLPDGSIIWGASALGLESLQELSPDGSQRTIWTCDPGQVGGMCTSNAVSWNEETDTLLFSLVTLNSVVELDRRTGEELRWFGDQPQSYSLDPAFGQFYKQHGVQLTEEGTLLMSCWDAEEGQRLLVREYEIDDEQQTLELIWTYVQEPEVFAYVLGDVVRLDSGNTLHSLGRGGHLRELSAEGELAWDLAWPESTDIGRASALADLYPLLPQP